MHRRGSSGRLHRLFRPLYVLGCLVVQFFDVIVHLDPDIIVFLHDLIVLLAVAPELVRLASVQVAAAEITVVEHRNVV